MERQRTLQDAIEDLLMKKRLDLSPQLWGLWQRFEGCFANKGTLGRRFGQLVDLRNGIRRSHSVDEITRNEGGAAMLWFEQITVRTSPVRADLKE